MTVCNACPGREARIGHAIAAPAIRQAQVASPGLRNTGKTLCGMVDLDRLYIASMIATSLHVDVWQLSFLIVQDVCFNAQFVLRTMMRSRLLPLLSFLRVLTVCLAIPSQPSTPLDLYSPASIGSELNQYLPSYSYLTTH